MFACTATICDEGREKRGRTRENRRDRRTEDENVEKNTRPKDQLGMVGK